MRVDMSSRTVPTANGLERVARVGVEVRRLAFWGSVLLPLAYVPLLAGLTENQGESLAL